MHRKESLKRKISSITNETDPDTDPEDDSNEITKNIIVKEKIENKKVIFNNINLIKYLILIQIRLTLLSMNILKVVIYI